MALSAHQTRRLGMSIAAGLMTICFGGFGFAEVPREDVAAQGQHREVRRAEAIRVNVEIASTVHDGLPCLIRTNVRNDAPVPEIPEEIATTDDLMELPQKQIDSILRQSALANMTFPAFTPFTEHPLPVSISIINANDEIVVAHRDVSMLAFWTDHHGASPTMVTPGGRMFSRPIPPRPRLRISSGKTNTLLLDLSPWLASLGAGTYAISVRLYTWPEEYWESPLVQFEVETLPETVWKFICATVPSTPDVDGNDVTSFRWLSPDVDPLMLHSLVASDIWEDIAFHVVVGRAAASLRAEEITPELVRVLPPWLQPIA